MKKPNVDTDGMFQSLRHEVIDLMIPQLQIQNRVTVTRHNVSQTRPH